MEKVYKVTVLYRDDKVYLTRWRGFSSVFLHREDGPAIEYADGTKHWFIDGKRHREDGPAVECANGDKEWYLHGKEVTEAEVMRKPAFTCDGKIVEIEGKKYQLKEVK